MACSLVASRIVSMTFIPLLGYYLLRPAKTRNRPSTERRQHGFTGALLRVWRVLRDRASLESFHRLARFSWLWALFMSKQLRTAFFPG